MNWKNEAIDRLSRYNAMNQAVENIPKELTRLEKAVQGLRGVQPEKMAVTCNPGPRDDALIGNIIKRQELAEAYENARVWVDTTNCALDILPREERTILETMYISPQKGAVSMLCEALGMEQSSVYRKRDKALYQFTMALYGTA